MTPKKKPQTSKQKNSIRAKRIARLVRLLTQDETKDGSSLWTPIIKIVPDNVTDLEAEIILRGVVAGWLENLGGSACPHTRTTTMPSGKLFCVQCQNYI